MRHLRFLRLWACVVDPLSGWCFMQVLSDWVHSFLTLKQFRRSLKTHLFKHIFGHWQLQCRVTVFFVRWAQIDLITYLLRLLDSLPIGFHVVYALTVIQRTARIAWLLSGYGSRRSTNSWICILTMTSWRTVHVGEVSIIRRYSSEWCVENNMYCVRIKSALSKVNCYNITKNQKYACLKF